jgi:hypothetical protein
MFQESSPHRPRLPITFLFVCIAIAVSACNTPQSSPVTPVRANTPVPPITTPQIVVSADAQATSIPSPTDEPGTPPEGIRTETPQPPTPMTTPTPMPQTASFLEQHIANLYDLSRLPLLENSITTQFTSRNWSVLEHFFDYFIDDGNFFGPNYGYIDENGTLQHYRIVRGYDGKPEYEIVPRVQGPGYIARIWFAYQQHQSLNNSTDMSQNEEWNNWGDLGAMGNIRIYFDDELVPRIDFGIKDLFVGKNPFPAPLAAFYASADGGNINYVPIPFQHSIRVTTTGRPRLMQIQVKQLDPSDSPVASRAIENGDGSSSLANPSLARANPAPVESFTPQLAPGEQDAVSQAAQAWQTCVPKLPGDFRSFPLSIPHNNSAEVDFSIPATIAAMRVRIPRGMDDSVSMQVFWDGEYIPSISAPLRALFGTDARLLPYRALPMGIVSTDAELIFYNNIPMPFRSARFVFVNNRAETLPLTLEVVATQTTPGAEDSRLHAFNGTRRMEHREDDGDNYEVIDVAGSGKYLGSIFSAWDLDRRSLNGSIPQTWRFPYLESNLDVWIDGRLALPGTGIEDDFNASYYYVFAGYPQYNTRYCLAGMTLLDYSTPLEPSSQYRFYLNDAPEFHNHLHVEAQHGNKGNNLSVTYSSTAFWYQTK